MRNETNCLPRRCAFPLAVAGIALAIVLLSGIARTGWAQDAPIESVVYNFPLGHDGFSPVAGVLRDSAGNLYGTTQLGGSELCDQSAGCGVVFKLDASGHEQVLHVFQGEKDGAFPEGDLLRDSSGNLYGLAFGGSGGQGNGVLFKIEPNGLFVSLYVFTGQADGSDPIGNLVQDLAGNLYGTTFFGGSLPCIQGSIGCGTVFKVDPSGHETVLYSFTGGADGNGPGAGLYRDRAGNFYGTTFRGGDLSCSLGSGCGTVFKVTPDGHETVLHTFTNSGDGANPSARVIADRAGTLYGTTYQGGDLSCSPPNGCGTVFKLDSSHKFTILHTFVGGTDGAQPGGGLIRDAAGNLYGTSTNGGDPSCPNGVLGCGIVFRLDPSGTETILHTFAGGSSDGMLPFGDLMAGPGGALYGTASEGGTAMGGVIFKISLK